MTSSDVSTPSPTKKRPSLIVGVLVVLLLALAGLTAWVLISGRLPFGAPSFNGLVIQSPEPVADFTLTAHTGERLSLSDLRGKVTLLYFGYTFCPDACPTTLGQLKKLPAILGRDADQVQVVMISVDPERDTPQVLADYLAYFDPTFIGLTGTNDEILAAATPLGIYYQKHEGSAATGYLVDHTTSVMAIDKDGYLRLVYPHGTSGEEIAADMRSLIR